jgi:hypothetical protein
MGCFVRVAQDILLEWFPEGCVHKAFYVMVVYLALLSGIGVGCSVFFRLFFGKRRETF